MRRASAMRKGVRSAARNGIRSAAPLAIALAAGLLPAGCRRPAEATKATEAAKPTPSPEPRETANLLLITLDTLRPDALGFVSGSNATPAIDALAREGFVFPSAVSPVPLTFPAHSALMTGMLPRALGLRDNGQLLPPDPPTLAQRLAAHGYATAAFVSGYPLHSAFGLDRGFSHYDDAFDSGKGDEPERKASVTVAAARAWLADSKAARAPWFLWVHLYDPHYPYEPPREFRRPGARGPYDGEVAYADSAIGELLRAAAAAETATGTATLTVFAGDHGESLGEHGEGTHGFFVYDSTVLVPLIFHFPSGPRASPAACRSDRARAGARLIDVAPTILDLLGISLEGEVAEHLDGRSVVPLFRGGASATARRPSRPTSRPISPGCPTAGRPSARCGPTAGSSSTRPGPSSTTCARIRASGATASRTRPRRRAASRSCCGTVQETAAAAPRPVADAEALARLRSLGYLGGSTPGAEPPAQGLRDPKDGAAVRELLTQGNELLRRGEARAAAIRFESALEQDPDNRFALQRSGVALLELGQLPAALSRLDKAVRLGTRSARGALGAGGCPRPIGAPERVDRAVGGRGAPPAPPRGGVGESGIGAREGREGTRGGRGDGARGRAVSEQPGPGSARAPGLRRVRRGRRRGRRAPSARGRAEARSR